MNGLEAARQDLEAVRSLLKNMNSVPDGVHQLSQQEEALILHLVCAIGDLADFVEEVDSFMKHHLEDGHNI